MSVDLEFQSQLDLLSSIKHFITNTNKTGKEKRNAQFYLARLKLLENYWKTFFDNHKSLRAYAEHATHEEKDYFVKDMYTEGEIL